MTTLLIVLFGQSKRVVVCLTSVLMLGLLHLDALLKGIVPGTQPIQLVLVESKTFLLVLLPDIVFLSRVEPLYLRDELTCLG